MSSGINIHVNLDQFSLNDALSPQIVSAVEASIATSLALIRDRWQTEAQQRLRSTLTDYLLGLNFGSIQQPYDSPLTGAVVLLGDLPNAIERGWGAFDMKIGFGKSSKIKHSQDGGWYLTIPFRHTTPGSSGTFGTPMTKDIYGVAKQLSPYGSGTRNTSMVVPGAGDKSWTGYVHKSNKNSGMVRIVKSYQKARQSQYMTFRRVSDKSDPASWMHPGYHGAHIADKLESYARNTFNTVLSNNLQSLTI